VESDIDFMTILVGFAFIKGFNLRLLTALHVHALREKKSFFLKAYYHTAKQHKQ
jgi:hypothetical protein